jgi:hypothetical protein
LHALYSYRTAQLKHCRSLHFAMPGAAAAVTRLCAALAEAGADVALFSVAFKARARDYESLRFGGLAKSMRQPSEIAQLAEYRQARIVPWKAAVLITVG